MNQINEFQLVRAATVCALHPLHAWMQTMLSHIDQDLWEWMDPPALDNTFHKTQPWMCNPIN